MSASSAHPANVATAAAASPSAVGAPSSGATAATVPAAAAPSSASAARPVYSLNARVNGMLTVDATKGPTLRLSGAPPSGEEADALLEAIEANTIATLALRADDYITPAVYAALEAKAGIRRVDLASMTPRATALVTSLLRRAVSHIDTLYCDRHFGTVLDSGCVFRFIDAIAQHRALETLSVIRAQDRQAEWLSMIGAHPTLTTVNLSDCKVDLVGVDAFAAALRANLSSRLRRLDLGNNDISGEGATALCAALEAHPALRINVFSLCGNRIGPAGVEAVARMLKVSSSLNLNDCGCGAAGAVLLAEALKTNDTLAALNLDGNTGIGTLGVQSLAAMLSMNCTIRALDLSNCRLDDAGAAALAGSLAGNRSTALVELRLCASRIMDDGVIALMMMLHLNATLIELDIERAVFGAGGLRAIGDMLLHNRTLKRLHAKSGLKHGIKNVAECIALIKPNTTLTYLSLNTRKQDQLLIAAWTARNATIPPPSRVHPVAVRPRLAAVPLVAPVEQPPAVIPQQRMEAHAKLEVVPDSIAQASEEARRQAAQIRDLNRQVEELTRQASVSAAAAVVSNAAAVASNIAAAASRAAAVASDAAAAASDAAAKASAVIAAAAVDAASAATLREDIRLNADQRVIIDLQLAGFADAREKIRQLDAADRELAARGEELRHRQARSRQQ
jgi:Ran GTPase-activating protein (RanGAP) involved in mRNA processing and transport